MAACPLCGQNSSHMLVITLPSRNFVGGGNKLLQTYLYYVSFSTYAESEDRFSKKSVATSASVHIHNTQIKCTKYRSMVK